MTLMSLGVDGYERRSLDYKQECPVSASKTHVKVTIQYVLVSCYNNMMLLAVMCVLLVEPNISRL